MKDAKIPPRDLSRTEYSLRTLCGLARETLTRALFLFSQSREGHQDSATGFIKNRIFFANPCGLGGLAREIYPHASIVYFLAKPRRTLRFRQGIHQEQNILCEPFADLAAWRERVILPRALFFSRKAAKGAKIPPRDLSRTEYSLRILCGLGGLAREISPPASIVFFSQS